MVKSVDSKLKGPMSIFYICNLLEYIIFIVFSLKTVKNGIIRLLKSSMFKKKTYNSWYSKRIFTTPMSLLYHVVNLSYILGNKPQALSIYD